MKIHEFPGLEMKLKIFMIFQVFHDPCEPCCLDQVINNFMQFEISANTVKKKVVSGNKDRKCCI